VVPVVPLLPVILILMLRLYNTLTRQIEDFKPTNPPNVGFYSCGPTVYDYSHIGHARTYVFADILQRTLECNGFKVKRVMNITDVGHLTSDSDTGQDKMEKGAAREKKSVWEIAKFYTDDFWQLLSKLNIKKPEIVCRATDHIGSMVALIEELEKRSFTYKIDDGIYFDTSKFPEYGILTGQSWQDLQKTLKAGARVEVVEGKKYPTDFALWKLTQSDVKRQMEWDSPWGKGFPGWHIECSAMSMKYLGQTIDIHSGGVDHISIHHSNEIAQSEAATGVKFVNYWLHGEHLLVDGNKMSKSQGNFYRVEDLEKKGYHPLSLRYLFLTTSYRQQLNFTFKSLDAAQSARHSLVDQISNIKSAVARRERVSLSEEKLDKIGSLRDKFIESINYDLNTAEALSIVWSTLKSNIAPGDKLELLLLFDEVLGLGIDNITVKAEDKIPEEIVLLGQQREKYRIEKKWEEGDKIRIEIEKKGFSIEDTPKGFQIKRHK